MTLTIGILMGSRGLQLAVSGQPIHENINYYEEYASIYGLKPIFFSINDINLSKDCVYAYSKDDNNNYVKCQFSIPKVIHNRSMLFKRKHLLIIEWLIRKKYVKIYNIRTRYTKLFVHKLLNSDSRMRPYLPETVLFFKPSTFFPFLRKHTTCIVKPISNSLGKGVIKVVRVAPFRFRIHYSNGGKQFVLRCNRRQLWRKLRQLTRTQPFIVQRSVPLACYQGKPFDIRVSVQKNDQGEWQITGMVAKVAKEGHYLTNVAQGGSAISLNTILKEIPNVSVDVVRDKVRDVALLATSILDVKIPGLADLGYDIGVDATGRPYIIELNCQDQRYSFELAGETETWKKTFKNPIGYGKHLYCQMDKTLSLFPEPKSLLPVIWNPLAFFSKNKEA